VPNKRQNNAEILSTEVLTGTCPYTKKVLLNMADKYRGEEKLALVK
jgi:hypothetical protein